MKDVYSSLQELGCSITPCGSKVTCSPIPDGADTDFLIKIPIKQEVVAKVVNMLGGFGFLWEGSEHYQDAADTFMSWRNTEENVNLIITNSTDFHSKHIVATALCKRLNLLVKADRISLFQAVLYGIDDYDTKTKGKEQWLDR